MSNAENKTDISYLNLHNAYTDLAKKHGITYSQLDSIAVNDEDAQWCRENHEVIDTFVSRGVERILFLKN